MALQWQALFPSFQILKLHLAADTPKTKKHWCGAPFDLIASAKLWVIVGRQNCLPAKRAVWWRVFHGVAAVHPDQSMAQRGSFADLVVPWKTAMRE